MKKQFCTIFFAFIGLTAFAQITVTDAHVASIGDIFYQAYDANPAGSINVGNSGVGESWNFSGLQVSYIDTVFFISPVGTPNANLYNNSNICMDDKGSISYFNKSSAGLYIHGVGDTVFNSPALYLPLPLTYGLTISDGPIVVIEQIITGPLLSSAMPSATVAVLTGGQANRADTALIQVTNTTDFEVDASGTITIPLGIYDVLRLKTTQNTSSVLNVYCSDTVSGMGAWINNIPFSSIPILANFSNDEQEIKYQWITDDASVKFLLAEIVVDSLDNIINGVSFQTIPSSSFVAELPQNTFNVYPIPASNQLTIESKSSNLTDVTLLDVMGKLVFSDKFKGTTQIDLTQISKGIYYLNLKTTEGELTKKIIVE
jgi:hypothetical protein